MLVQKAVITAADRGTRFLPVTKSQPKETLPLLNRPIIQYSVEETIACGVELVVIMTALGKKAIEDYFDRHFQLETILQEEGETKLLEEVGRSSNMVDIAYIRQKGQLGLGHAVLTAQNIIGTDPFVLLLPDDLFEHSAKVILEMIRIFEECKGGAVAVRRVDANEVSRYGVIKCHQVAERIYEVADRVEKPRPGEAPSNLAIMGRWILAPEIFAALRETPPGRNDEIQLTDALRQLLKERSLYAYDFKGERCDAGTLEGWLETTLTLALRYPRTGPRLARAIFVTSCHLSCVPIQPTP